MSLLNKVALVTGASSGIGAAIALKFVSEGAKVAIVGRNEAKLKSVSEICEKSGSKPLTIIGDVSKDDKKIVSDTLKHFGNLDILVNNAGTGVTTGLLSDNAMEVFDQVMATNIRSVVSITNLAGPHLVKSKGNIINISSTTGIGTFLATGFAYSTSKAAVDHFTRMAATELARSGVRVNGINPGPVNTDIMVNAGVSDAEAAKMFDMMKRGTILKRVSEAEEIADMVLFLASDKAKGITGASFVIDNGTLLRR